MLILSRKPRTGFRAESWSLSIDAGLRAAGRRILWRRRLSALAFTLPILALAVALYVGVARFTFLELPRWPVLLFFVPWLIGLAVWSARQRITSAEAARFLDQKLHLDERMSTCVEVINSARLRHGPRPSNGVSHALFVDAAEALDSHLYQLPGPFRVHVGLPNALAVAGTLLLLGGALILPAGVDLLRAEKSALSQSVQEQLTTVESLKLDIANNKALSSDLQKSMLGELDSLESKLKAPGIDQAGGIAALADTEEQLRSQLQTPSSDFDALVAAAQVVAGGVESNLSWDPEQAVSKTDLGRAAEATAFLAGQVSQLGTNQERRLASTIDRGSSQAATSDAKLGAQLGAGAEAIRTRDRNKAAQALTQAAAGFAQADRERENSVALETTLSKLNKGREQIAQIGKPAGPKAQVGFRRRGAGAGSASQTTVASPSDQTNPNDAQGDGSAQGGQRSGTGGALGSSAPAYGGTQPGGPSSAAPGGPPSANSGQGGNQSAGSSNVAGGSGKNAQPGGLGGTSQSVSAGSAGGSSGNTGQTGTLQGQINGPVGGTSGAISQVKNPAGTGAGASSDQGGQAGTQASADDEQVYLPPKSNNTPGEPAAEGTPGEASTGDPQTAGQAGRAGSGGDSGAQTASGRGLGGLAPVHTPYKEVIGQYAAQATDALERAYIPPDAKDYVRDYFSGLGK